MDQDINCHTIGCCTYGAHLDREILDLVSRELRPRMTMEEQYAAARVPLSTKFGRQGLPRELMYGIQVGVAFSPDGKRLATASGDGTVQVYAIDPRELLNLAHSRVTRDFTADVCQRYFQSATCPPLP